MATLQLEDTKAADSDLAALIDRARASDQAAAKELVALTRPIVMRIARAHRSKRSTEEDLMQDIFVKVFSRLHQYRGDAPFEHWVSRIAVTTCLDHLRVQHRRPELRMADLPECEAITVEHTQCDSRVRMPGQVLATRELLDYLLGRLRPDDRKLIVWFELEERTIADIEALTGWSFSFVKMRLFRARLKLRRFLSALSTYDGADNPGAIWSPPIRAKRKKARHAETSKRPRRTDDRSNAGEILFSAASPRDTQLILSPSAEPALEVA